MALFNILEPADGKPERVIFIREGFSWGALIFTVLWALFHRMWVVAACLFAVIAVVAVAESRELIGPALGAALNLAIAVIFGFEARRLQAYGLERAGFRPAGLIEASSLEAAELRYFAGRTPEAPAPPAPVRIPAHPADTLGIFGNV